MWPRTVVEPTLILQKNEHMKLIEALATDYWIEHTQRIYKENLHVSTPVMEAYEAGFNKAKTLILSYLINELGQTEDLSLNDAFKDFNKGIK